MKFFHIRPKLDNGSFKRHGGTCVGYERLTPNKLLISFARCSERDVYTKSVARSICSGRMAAGLFVPLEQPEGSDLYEALIAASMENERKVKEAYRHG